MHTVSMAKLRASAGSGAMWAWLNVKLNVGIITSLNYAHIQSEKLGENSYISAHKGVGKKPWLAQVFPCVKPENWETGKPYEYSKPPNVKYYPPCIPLVPVIHVHAQPEPLLCFVPLFSTNW